MAYCIKTYKERDVKDTQLAKITGKFGNFFIDMIEEKFTKWIREKPWRIIFYPIIYLSFLYLYIFLVLIIIVFGYFVSEKKTFFIKGKKYEECDEDEDSIVLIGEQENLIFRKKLKIKSNTNFREFIADIFTPKYQKYFVNNIKEVRKLKLKNLK